MREKRTNSLQQVSKDWEGREHVSGTPGRKAISRQGTAPREETSASCEDKTGNGILVNYSKSISPSTKPVPYVLVLSSHSFSQRSWQAAGQGNPTALPKPSVHGAAPMLRGHPRASPTLNPQGGRARGK